VTHTPELAAPAIPSLEDLRAADERLRPWVVATPLVRFSAAPPGMDMYLKLENLQPIGSFKLRGAANTMLQADPALLRDGVWTASAGNMAQGVAYMAAQLGVRCRVVVPDHAPAAKTAAVERLGAAIVRVPFAEWWSIIETHTWRDAQGLFVHPVSDPRVMAGNGTIGFEIARQLPDVRHIVVPFGGGGLSCGIAAAARVWLPDVRVYAASLAAGEPVSVEYQASFVDGIGGRSVLREMWPLARALLEDSLVVSLRQVADAVRLLVERNRIIAEGAGAASVAAALAHPMDGHKIVCVVSGGNIDTAKVVRILDGEIP
jgi:threonine dehydratase